MCIPFEACCEEKIAPPNEKSKSLVSILQKLFICQIILGLCKLILSFMAGGIGMSGISELVASFFLYKAFNRIDFCSCIIYILFCLYSTVTSLDNLFAILQNGAPLFTNNSARNFQLVLGLISIIFYIFSVYFTFQAYKEFKAISYEQGGGLSRNYQRDNSEDYEMQRGQPQFIGGGNQMQGAYQQQNLAPIPNVGPPNYNQQQSSNAGRGGFQAFSGQGVAVGGGRI